MLKLVMVCQGDSDDVVSFQFNSIRLIETDIVDSNSTNIYFTDGRWTRIRNKSPLQITIEINNQIELLND